MSEILPGPTQTVNADRVGTAINAGVILFGRNAASEQVIDEHDRERLQAVYVRTGGYEEAAAKLAEGGIVALVANPGTGRRITAQALLTERGSTPSEIAVDLDHPEHLIADADRGYVIQIEKLGTSQASRQRAALNEYLQTIREEDTLAVVCVAPDIAAMLELTQYLHVVRLRRAEPSAVFVRHLEHRRDARIAERWRSAPAISQSLAGVAPADAARLAELADRSMAAHPNSQFEDQVNDAIGAFTNWTADLDNWFGPAGDKKKPPAARALLLATAVLDGRPAASVFWASRLLEDQLELPHEPGHGLSGDPATTQAEGIAAELTAGKIGFIRPAYAEAVLDYVWERWPQLHPDVRDWLIDLVARTDLEEDDRVTAAKRLTEFAVRQRTPELIFKACGKWLQGRLPFRLAVECLTIAGMSAETGRDTRQRLYDWSTQSRSVYHPIVVEVCAGPLAEAFPGVALTRLRHVANNGDDQAKERVIAAVCVLATHTLIRSQVWKTLVEWVRDGRGRPQSEVAEQSIAAVLAAADEDHNPQALYGHPRRARLTDMWRVALNSASSRETTGAAVTLWLDTALRTPAIEDTVIDVLASTCDNQLDLANLTGQIYTWSRSSSEVDEEARGRLFQALIGRLTERVPGASRTAMDRAYGPTIAPET